MDAREFAALRKSVSTPHGEIAYVEAGSGPAALFVHGVLLNGYLWRDSIEALADVRRCIAIDILGHGNTKAKDGLKFDFGTQAEMIGSFLDALGIDAVDIVANDSGGGITQLFAANYPQRVRSLVLTDCDAHDNYPPAALESLFNVTKAGGLPALGKQFLENPATVRASFGVAYENVEAVSDETIRTYLEPLFNQDTAGKGVERFLLDNEDNSQNVVIEPRLRQLQAPALIIWGTDDVFFDKKWAYWLKDTLPGARDVVELEGARLFFPEERPEWFAQQVRGFWASVGTGAGAAEVARA